ncbi:hypothetical protein LXL04_001884 [Taraxacum kok-saghyz]
MSFEIGESVEVIGNEDGMEEPYFKGKETSTPSSHCVNARYHLGDMVDAWHNEGWWVGRYVRREGENYTVFFENEAPENQHVSYPKAKIRVHQEWKELETGGKWKYVKK